MEHSPALTFALEHAQKAARRQGSTQVDGLHLLLGLIHEEEGQPARLLADAGLDPLQARTSLGGDDQSDIDPIDTPLPLSGELVSVLRQGRELARTLSAEGTITSDQVLLALLREDLSLRGTFESLGLDFGRLEEKVIGQQPLPLHLEAPFPFDDTHEEIDAARILDANANRAREALRVLEDYCRFVLGDAFLSRELKTLRHDLAAGLELLPGNALIQARETLADVGATISTEREGQRDSLRDVVAANCKRLEEALRTLEEYGKLSNAAFAAVVEALRYRSYTIEKSLSIIGYACERLADVQLYVLVTDELCRTSLPGTVAEALAGGAQMIQLREKKLDDRALLSRAKEVRRLTRKHGALFIVNDRPDIARLCDADGVHLGQDDLPVHAARRILGANALIGVSTHNLEQVQQAVRDGASYIGVGPTFPSGTKEFAEFAGLEFVRQRWRKPPCRRLSSAASLSTI